MRKSRAQYRCTNKHSLHDSEEKKVYMEFTHHLNREMYKIETRNEPRV